MTRQRKAIGLGAFLILAVFTHPAVADGMGLAQPAAAAVAAGAQIEKRLIAPLREAVETQVVRYINAQRALHGLPALGS